MEKSLGKIESIRLGYGGYQDAMFGVSVTLAHGGWHCSDFIGTWAPSLMPCASYTQWTEADRDEQFAKVMRKIDQWMSEAKVDRLNQLVGVPVEVTVDGMQLSSWRILTEVI